MALGTWRWTCELQVSSQLRCPLARLYYYIHSRTTVRTPKRPISLAPMTPSFLYQPLSLSLSRLDPYNLPFSAISPRQARCGCSSLLLALVGELQAAAWSFLLVRHVGGLPHPSGSLVVDLVSRDCFGQTWAKGIVVRQFMSPSHGVNKPTSLMSHAAPTKLKRLWCIV